MHCIATPEMFESGEEGQLGRLGAQRRNRVDIHAKTDSSSMSYNYCTIMLLILVCKIVMLCYNCSQDDADTLHVSHYKSNKLISIMLLQLRK